MASHSADEFLGLTEREARARAEALGWAYRDRTRPGWFTDDDRHHDRINVVYDARGRVCWAETA